MEEGKNIEKIHLGASAEFSKKLSEDDIRQFEGALGDPTCSRAKAAPSSGPSAKAGKACEMLSAGLICTVLESLLPGSGMRYLSQTLHFRQPVYVGDTITVHVTVTEMHEMSNWMSLSTVCRNQKGEIVTDGEAQVMPPGR